jgi:hypothetical protein
VAPVKTSLRAAPGYCLDCVLPAVLGQKRCEYHRELNRGAAQNRYQRDRQRMRERIAALPAIPDVALATPPEGTNPQRCDPFRTPAAATVMQRLDCLRRQQCLGFVIRQGWQAFTCSGCSVRETAPKVELQTRRGSDEAVPYPRCA